MPRRVILPPELGSVFSVRDALQAGLGYGRVRGRDLERPFHGVRARDVPASDRPEVRIQQLADLYSPRLRTGQFFCDTTALALYGLPLPRDESVEWVHVGVPSPRRAPRTRAVIGHELRSPILGRAGGHPVCSPLEAWAQSAARLSVRDLVVIGDALVRRRSPLSSLTELAKHVESRRGCRGFCRLAEASALVRPGTDSPMETLLRVLIVEAGLPEPQVNAPIRDDRGHQLGLGDLVFRQWNVVVEYDGGYHFASDSQIHRDIERLASFAEAGQTVIRVHKLHLAQPHFILRRIRSALHTAGWREPAKTARTRSRSSRS